MENKKKKIIYYTSSLASGGAERQLVYTAIGAKKAGYDPLIIVDYQVNHYEKMLEEYDIPVFFTNTTRFNPIKRFLKLIKITLKVKPDIFHSFLSIRNLCGMFISKICRVPLRIASIRNTNKKAFEGLKLYNRWSHIIICNSNAARSYAIKEYKIPEEKVMVFYNSIDLNKFKFEDKKGSSGRKIVGITIASITEKKNHLNLVEALIDLNKKEMLNDIDYFLVGKKTNESIFDEIMEKIEKNNLNGKVKYLGVRDDIHDILNRCDFLILPSLYEGFPNVAMEAMATKTFVMATDVGGTSELVIDNSTGYLIPTPSKDDIEKCIERYLNTEREVLEKIIDNAYLNIQKYDLNNMFKQIEYIYEREVTK